MYGQKKDEDVFLKHLRDYRDGELGLYSNSWGNSLGREARLREQQRAQEEAQANRAYLAEWERQQAAQRAGSYIGSSARSNERQSSISGGKELLGPVGAAFVIVMLVGVLGRLLEGLGLI